MVRRSVWRSFGTAKYEVSEKGQIRSFKVASGKPPRILSTFTTKAGIKVVNLSDYSGLYYCELVARIVAIAFIPNPNKYKYVQFYDGNPSNVNHLNIYWSEKKMRRKALK